MNLQKKVEDLKKSTVKSKVDQKIKSFESKQTNQEWFAEMCFCILTANSKAETALNIEKKAGIKGFLEFPQEKLAKIIRTNKHRFHNNKAKFIVQARKHKNIKDILKKQTSPRDWLVKNIKGLGLKESSHFLRNVGYKDYAIIDRHILKVLDEDKTITPKKYFEIENKLKQMAKSLNLNLAELDLYLWYIQTGKILK